jgi:hypothetical protein
MRKGTFSNVIITIFAGKVNVNFDEGVKAETPRMGVQG